MRFNLKFLSAAVVFFSLVSFSGRYQPVISEVSYLNQKIDEVTQDAFAKAEQYLPDYGSDGTNRNRKMLNLQESDDAPDGMDEFYFVDVAKDLYSEMGEEEKEVFENLCVNNSEDSNLFFFYSLFADDEFTKESLLEDEENTDAEEKENMFHVSTRKNVIGGEALLLAALDPWLSASLLGGIATFIADLNIPIWGWAIAMAVIVTMEILIIVNWNKINLFWQNVITLFVTPLPAFATAIKALLDGISARAAKATVDGALSKTKKDAKDKGWNDNWPDNELRNALDKSIHVGSGAYTAESLANRGDKLHVYLGKYYKDDKPYTSYTTYGCNNNGTYFSLSTYNYYESKGYNMWILNAFFLELVIDLGCDFKLCSKPSLYYNKATKLPINGSGSYGMELQFINLKGYEWYTDIPIVTADLLMIGY